MAASALLPQRPPMCCPDPLLAGIAYTGVLCQWHEYGNTVYNSYVADYGETKGASGGRAVTPRPAAMHASDWQHEVLCGSPVARMPFFSILLKSKSSSAAVIYFCGAGFTGGVTGWFDWSGNAVSGCSRRC